MADYNTFMDKSVGQKSLDLHARQRLKINEEYKDLKGMKHLYVWGDPGSGKSLIVDMFYETLCTGQRKQRMHFSEFMLKVHEMEHKVN